MATRRGSSATTIWRKRPGSGTGSHEGHIGAAVGQASGRVVPADLPQGHGGLRPGGGEPGPDRREHATATRARAYPDDQGGPLAGLRLLGGFPVPAVFEQRRAQLTLQHADPLAQRWL